MQDCHKQEKLYFPLCKFSKACSDIPPQHDCPDSQYKNVGIIQTLKERSKN